MSNIDREKDQTTLQNIIGTTIKALKEMTILVPKSKLFQVFFNFHLLKT